MTRRTPWGALVWLTLGLTLVTVGLVSTLAALRATHSAEPFAVVLPACEEPAQAATACVLLDDGRVILYPAGPYDNATELPACAGNSAACLLPLPDGRWQLRTWETP